MSSDALLNTLGKAVEQLAGYLAKTKISSRGRSATVLLNKMT